MAHLARGFLAIGTLLTFVGYSITVGGLAALQWKANDLNVKGVTNGNATAPLTVAYTQTFMESNYIPYPFSPGYQFGLAWWVVQGELIIWLVTAILLLLPAHVQSAKLIVLTWIASFQTAVWYHINTLLFLSRNEVAKFAFGSSRIDTTLAGLTIVAVGNGVTISALALYNRHESKEAHSAHVSATPKAEV